MWCMYWWGGGHNGAGRPQQQTTVDMHAGESETSHTLVTRPDLVHQDRAGQESGNRLDVPRGSVGAPLTP